MTPGGEQAAVGRVAALALTGDERRARVAAVLRGLRWTVLEAATGAQLFALLERGGCIAAVLDQRLPDLETAECAAELGALWPGLHLLGPEGEALGGPEFRGPLRREILHALAGLAEEPRAALKRAEPARPHRDRGEAPEAGGAPEGHDALPELVGSSPALREVSRRIHLVAARRTPVLVHGPTGTGKELVARAVHRLSGRDGRFIAINCAAIPEALLESELFGHARGAFTGAVGARAGRIEAAAGGTVFFDEIGEMPPALQSKLLRFLESGELQRVGENEPVRVDARVVAATHRRLGAMAAEGTFRLDLLHRLAVFLIETPALGGRVEDLDALIELRLRALAAEAPGRARRLSEAARARLHAHAWPGNVRELEHTLERAWILAGDDRVIGEECIDFGSALG